MAHIKSKRQQAHEEDETTRRVLESGDRLKASARITPPLEPQVALPTAQIRVEPQFTRIGPYQVVCELASGGMATVFLTLHRSVEGFQKLCAVKRLHAHLANDRAFAEMFVDEAQIAARISHPYVCSVFSFGRSSDGHFIAMEFLRGEPLSAVARQLNRSPELRDNPQFPLLAARMIANLAEGLHAAHTLRDDQGATLDVVHRDVTPQNLFVMYDGSVRVTDFGIAQARQRLHHTQGQKLKGKLSYIAPELLNHATPTAQVDVWGLGVVLWELLAGRRLFLGSNEGETVAAVMSRAVVPPSSFRATVPAELDRIVLRALERDAQRRYRSARDLARDLERFLKASGDSVPAMDIADWMALVFPEGAARMQGLVELAAHVSRMTADETVVRVPSAPPAAGIRGSLPSLPTLPVATTVYAAPPSDRPPDTRQKHPPPLPPVPAGEVDAAPAMPPREPIQAPVEARGVLHWRWLIPPAVAALLLVSWWGFTKPVPPSPRAAALATAHEDARTIVPAVSVLDLPLEPTAVDAADTEITAVESPPVLVVGPRNAPSTSPTRNANPVRAPSASPSAQEAAPILAQGDVYVTTPGGSAEVLLDGRLVGRTPQRFKASAGRHDLILRTADGQQQSLSVTVSSTSPTLVTAALAPSPSAP